jgi:C4-dicarboxylate transporter, DctM subunit
LWFAALFEVNMEIGLITPPTGINFFLARNVFKINATDLFRGVIPFLIMCVAFPEISTWLPGSMLGK